MKIQDIKTYFICPAHNEKYKERAQHMKSLLTSLGFKNWIHWTSGTENYPSCLTQAMLSILQENMNNEPILILEDDVEFTGRDDVQFNSQTDAVQLGLSKSGGSKTINLHDGPALQTSISEDQVQIYNMLSLHAKIYITKKYKLACIDALCRAFVLGEHTDVHIARIASNFQVWANKKPSFQQSDKLGNYPSVRNETDITFE